jgi:hypothetical protein
MFGGSSSDGTPEVSPEQTSVVVVLTPLRLPEPPSLNPPCSRERLQSAPTTRSAAAASVAVRGISADSGSSRTARRHRPLGDDDLARPPHAAVLLRPPGPRERLVRPRRQTRTRRDVLRHLPLLPAGGRVASRPRRWPVPHEGLALRAQRRHRWDRDRGVARGRNRPPPEVGDVLAEFIGAFGALAIHAWMRRAWGRTV